LCQGTLPNTLESPRTVPNIFKHLWRPLDIVHLLGSIVYLVPQCPQLRLIAQRVPRALRTCSTSWRIVYSVVP
jgi:hypothetical protein